MRNEEQISAVTAALIGPYVGMRFILKNSTLIWMKELEGALCEVVYIGDDGLANIANIIEDPFFFVIISGPHKRVPVAHQKGWFCWARAV